MDTLWSYSLSDLLLFSPRVYHRLFGLINEAAWPLQFVLLAVAAAIMFALVRPSNVRISFVFFVLGLIWIWIAWFFFIAHYATINWGARWVAPLFVLQGGLLLFLGWFAKSSDALAGHGHAGMCRVAAALLFGVVVAGYPLLAIADGRSLMQAEVFGLAADPTVAATLFVIATRGGRLAALAMIVPVLWCVVSGLTHWAMSTGWFWLAPAVAISALLIRGCCASQDRLGRAGRAGSA